MQSKLLIFVVISLLVIALIFSSYSRSDVFAKGKVTTGSLDCTSGINGREMCCQDETGSQGIVIRWCTICDATSPPSNCTPRFNSGSIPITPPKSNDGGSPKDSGVLPQGTTPPESSVNNPPTNDNNPPTKDQGKQAGNSSGSGNK